jgi:hypothetical protein
MRFCRKAPDSKITDAVFTPEGFVIIARHFNAGFNAKPV